MEIIYVRLGTNEFDETERKTLIQTGFYLSNKLDHYVYFDAYAEMMVKISLKYFITDCC